MQGKSKQRERRITTLQMEQCIGEGGNQRTKDRKKNTIYTVGPTTHANQVVFTHVHSKAALYIGHRITDNQEGLEKQTHSWPVNSLYPVFHRTEFSVYIVSLSPHSLFLRII